jgi:hypothetical protein
VSKAQELSSPIERHLAEPRGEVPGAPPLFGLEGPPPIIQGLPPLPRAESPGEPDPSAPKNPKVSPAEPKPPAE